MSLYTQACAGDSRQPGRCWPEDTGSSNPAFGHCSSAFPFAICTRIRFGFPFILEQKQVYSLLRQNVSRLISGMISLFFFFFFNIENSINETLQRIAAQARQFELPQTGNACSHRRWASQAEFKGHLPVSDRSA